MIIKEIKERSQCPCGVVYIVSSPPATEDIGAMGREFESRQKRLAI
jgi:hypothetical protein